jgi:hypothetical protein
MISLRFKTGAVIYVEENTHVIPFGRAVESWIEDRPDAHKYPVARPAPGRWPPPYDVEYGEEADR